MNRLIKTIIATTTLIRTATANSSGYYPGTGMDYYWVPGNQLLFHINYPLDFLLYLFAAIGMGWFIHQTYVFFKTTLFLKEDEKK